MSPTKTQQIASRLRNQINSGTWRPGERLPTHSELAEQWGVSSMTVRTAVQQLVAERLLTTGTSRGTVVRSRQILDHVVTDFIRPDRRPDPQADVFVETVLAAGRAARKEFSMHIEPADEQVAGWLGIAPNDWVVARTLEQFVDESPWTWEISYYPRDLAEQLGLDQPHDIPEGTTRRMAAHGVPEIGWRDIEGSRPATPEEAERLEVPVGTWIQDYVRIGATADRIVRVTRDRRVADANRTVHELGDEQALTVIRNTVARANASGEGA